MREDDRRVYPIEVRKVECRTHLEVAEAIRDMVTQSAGPYVAASMGMALAAHECRGRSEAEQLAYLEDALQNFCLENPMDGGAWATVHGVAADCRS